MHRRRAKYHRSGFEHHGLRFVEEKSVDARSISVETLNFTLMLASVVKNAAQKSAAESIARRVRGVKSLRNEIAVRM